MDQAVQVANFRTADVKSMTRSAILDLKSLLSDAKDATEIGAHHVTLERIDCIVRRLDRLRAEIDAY